MSKALREPSLAIEKKSTHVFVLRQLKSLINSTRRLSHPPHHHSHHPHPPHRRPQAAQHRDRQLFWQDQQQDRPHLGSPSAT